MSLRMPFSLQACCPLHSPSSLPPIPPLPFSPSRPFPSSGCWRGSLLYPPQYPHVLTLKGQKSDLFAPPCVHWGWPTAGCVAKWGQQHTQVCVYHSTPNMCTIFICGPLTTYTWKSCIIISSYSTSMRCTWTGNVILF